MGEAVFASGDSVMDILDLCGEASPVELLLRLKQIVDITNPQEGD